MSCALLCVRRSRACWCPCRCRLLGTLFMCTHFCIVGPRSWAGSPSWSVPLGVSCCCVRCYTYATMSVTKRRFGKECKSRQELEQETIKRTHSKLQPTNAGQQRYTSHKPQSPNQAAVQASNQHTTLTSHRPLCHRGTRQRYRGVAPTAGVTGGHAVHIQVKPRLRGNPLASVTKPRHARTDVLGRNKRNRRKLGHSEP